MTPSIAPSSADVILPERAELFWAEADIERESSSADARALTPARSGVRCIVVSPDEGKMEWQFFVVESSIGPAATTGNGPFTGFCALRQAANGSAIPGLIPFPVMVVWLKSRSAG